MIDPVFEVHMLADGKPTGHVYRIFSDGRIEGFGDSCFILNRYPLRLREEIELERKHIHDNRNPDSSEYR